MKILSGEVLSDDKSFESSDTIIYTNKNSTSTKNKVKNNQADNKTKFVKNQNEQSQITTGSNTVSEDTREDDFGAPVLRLWLHVFRCKPTTTN